MCVSQLFWRANCFQRFFFNSGCLIFVLQGKRPCCMAFSKALQEHFKGLKVIPWCFKCCLGDYQWCFKLRFGARFICYSYIFLDDLIVLQRFIVKLQVLSLRLGVDFTLTLDSNWNHNHNNENPHLNFLKGTVLGVKEQGLGIRDRR